MPFNRRIRSRAQQTTYALLLVLGFTFQASVLGGQYNNYPFSVQNEKTPNGHRIVAHNGGPAPISVKLAIIDSQFINTDRPFPVYAVVPPSGGTLYLGNISQAMPNVGYTFRTNYTWSLGDFNATPSPDAIYRLPYRDGLAFHISQAAGGPITTHTSPDNQFAVDIPMPQGTPILAARDGTVIYTEANQIYGGQTPDMLSKANEVKILHVDGTIGVYAHLAHGGVYVYSGQKVFAGQQIGLAGSTGYSSGPHLHFAVQTLRRVGDKIETVSLPFQFYVGTPPQTFIPTYGMLVRADYSGPGVSPNVRQVAQQATEMPAVQQDTPRQSVQITLDPVIVTWFANVRRELSNHDFGWYWIIGIVLFLMLRWMKNAVFKRNHPRIQPREPWIDH